MRFICGGVVLAAVIAVFAVEKEKPEPKRAPFGIDKRIPWTTSRVQGSPEPPPPYRLEAVFPKLKFDEPLELAAVPGSNSWIVAQRRGKIFTFENDPVKAEKHLLIDLKKTVYGVVPHPKFVDNGYIYVTYIVDADKDQPDGSRLARFKVNKADPPEADPDSEKVLLTWPSGGHNGGCIRFGPDGYLYLSTGDGSGIADSLETGQDLGDLLAAMLRIDVDKHDMGKAYRVPPDNPFVGLKGARPEIWAYGLRQAWKYSFDSKTGELWAGEVGQDLWESVYKIVKGGNYGWSVNEGSHPFRPERKKGPTPILKPIIEHNHTEFRSLTGGYVYHGKRLKELQDAYIYGDFDTGRVWMLRYDGTKVTEHRELAKSRHRIVAWGQDKAGEVYALDFIEGGIYQLVPAPAVVDAPKFPRKLSETGLFASTRDLKPAPGLIPYSVNAELWSDGAHKERYLALPGKSQIEYNTVTYPQPAPGSRPGWRFPDGAVLVKTFFLDIEAGNPKSRRRLETRLLHVARYPGSEEVGDQVWNGYTYLWNDDQTDADLIDSKGLDVAYTIKDAKADGGSRKQTWHYPSRAECNMCHTVTAKYALGVNNEQMNRDHNYDGVVANQLATLDHLGIFTKPLPEKPEKIPHIVDYRDRSQPLDARARSYLHANCSHCHRKWGGGNAEFQLLETLPLKETGTVGVKPAHGTFDLKDPSLLLPGDPERSLIWQRMKKRGLGQMPHIASNVVDQDAVELIEEWIKKMK
jgi:uncharacterized repeat protein (TIGR03806 family)